MRIRTSPGVITTGTRSERRARTTSVIHGSGSSSTTRYRKRTALNAWFCVCRTHMRINSETGQECVDLIDTHGGWMPLVVEQNETLDPRDVGFLSTPAVMTHTDRLAQSRSLGPSLTRRGSLGLPPNARMSTPSRPLSPPRTCRSTLALPSHTTRRAERQSA